VFSWNPITAMAENNILAIVAFAIFMGIAIIVLKERAQTVLTVINEFFNITMTIVRWIMRLAPWGIMGLLAKLVASQNIELLSILGKYIAVVMGTTLFMDSSPFPPFGGSLQKISLAILPWHARSLLSRPSRPVLRSPH